ncbi:MAG TPA: lipid A deacylase LpxR family protein [Acetobacteraceae bacterium]|nr:lipid A deacylase LpxR family protein [Acetobacteraceae bacterium]
MIDKTRGLCLLALATLLPLASPARAATPAGSDGTLTLRIENDTLNDTDRYYTAGDSIGWTGPVGEVPDVLGQLGHHLWGDGQQRISLGVSQLLFTPANTQINPPDPKDRPYAGLLLGGMSLIQDTPTRRDVLRLDLGVIGPDALGEQAQNGFHHLIGETTNKGWSYQLPNQPVVEVIEQRIWRVRLGTAGPLEVDMLPELTGSVGTWRVAGEAGAMMRIGQGLGADFGAPRIQPGLTGDDAYQTARRFAWYAFVGVDGQAVAWDETIEGEPFASTRHVTLEPLLGEAEIGIAVIVDGVRASFTHVMQTQSFRGQSGGLFWFDSLSMSVPF